MIITKEIILNNIKYESIIFNINGLIKLMKIKPNLITSFGQSIASLRKTPIFDVYNLIKENVRFYPETNIFHIIHLNDLCITTARLIYTLNSNLKNAYINMVYTNPEYRGKQLCQTNINILIKKTKKIFNLYELEVNPDNTAAIKCYEKLGFNYVKTIKYKDYYLNLMTLSLI